MGGVAKINDTAFTQCIDKTGRQLMQLGQLRATRGD
jgi:hypothetical protein